MHRMCNLAEMERDGGPDLWRHVTHAQLIRHAS
jgi:hypothetical protein